VLTLALAHFGTMQRPASAPSTHRFTVNSP